MLQMNMYKVERKQEVMAKTLKILIKKLLLKLKDFGACGSQMIKHKKAGMQQPIHGDIWFFKEKVSS